MPHTHPLVDKTAPALSLPNYDGQTYNFTPGSIGLPTALFFYPKSGQSQELTSYFRLSADCTAPINHSSYSQVRMGAQRKPATSETL